MRQSRKSETLRYQKVNLRRQRRVEGACLVLPCTEHIAVLAIQKLYNWHFAKANVITLSTCVGSASMSLVGGIILVGWLLGLEPKMAFARPLKAFAT
jgi:hypothetical protein